MKIYMVLHFWSLCRSVPACCSLMNQNYSLIKNCTKHTGAPCSLLLTWLTQVSSRQCEVTSSIPKLQWTSCQLNTPPTASPPTLLNREPPNYQSGAGEEKHHHTSQSLLAGCRCWFSNCKLHNKFILYLFVFIKYFLMQITVLWDSGIVSCHCC